jgi:hypothetical protein
MTTLTPSLRNYSQMQEQNGRTVRELNYILYERTKDFKHRRRK